MTIDFTENLHFTLKEGYNWVDYQTKNWYPYLDPVFTSSYPEVDMRKTTRIESNLEGLLSYNNSFGDFDFAPFGLFTHQNAAAFTWVCFFGC